MKLGLLLPVACLALLTVVPGSAKEPDAARVKEIVGWLAAEPAAVAPPITDRAAWKTLAADPTLAGILDEAAEAAKAPLPAQPDELYLDYSRTGNRERWQTVAFARRGRLSPLLIAECIEDKGRFIAPLEKLIAALCAEKSWLYPAHDKSLNNFREKGVDIDLGSSALAWELATQSRILGARLSPATRKLIRENLERRIFTPFRDFVTGKRPANFWMTGTNNWNAVCLAGVTGTALATLESPEQRAWFVAAAEDYIRHFLSGFTPDGYCSEGVGYWNYGFGHYVMLAEMVRRSTGGRLDMLADPVAVKPALFGARTEILGGIYPSIADCSPASRPGRALMTFLTHRFDFDLPEGLREAGGKSGKYSFERLLYLNPPRGLPKIPARKELDELDWRTWFPQGGVLICRPGPGEAPPFAACLKGGNNAEHHNHNDVGTFMVVSGKMMLICDPGSEVYTKRTFSSRRYESKVLSSFGHAVPVIAGKLQHEGASARGVVLESKFSPGADTLRLDIRSAYAVPELTRLERGFVFRRGASPSLTITDDVAFTKPSTYEAALITWGKWKRISENEIVIRDGGDSVRVKVDFGGAGFEAHGEILDEDVHTKSKPVRIALRPMKPVAAGQFKLTVTPAKP